MIARQPTHHLPAQVTGIATPAGATSAEEIDTYPLTPGFAGESKLGRPKAVRKTHFADGALFDQIIVNR